MPNTTENKERFTPEELKDFYFQVYGLFCPACNAKVLDPDKSKNQTFIKDNCPSCGVDPAEFRRQQKRERKENRRNRIKNNNKHQR